jgi:hypothetical protein
MEIIRVRTLAALFFITLLSGCVGYPYAHGQYSMPTGNGYGAGYPRQGQYENYGTRSYQQYQPNRNRGEYHEHEHDHGERGYGEHRRHDD